MMVHVLIKQELDGVISILGTYQTNDAVQKAVLNVIETFGYELIDGDWTHTTSKAVLMVVDEVYENVTPISSHQKYRKVG